MTGWRTIYVPVSKQDLLREYAEAGTAAEDYAKAKWGSHDSMMNRFALALDVIEWPGVRTWLDVGCGSARLFAMAEERGIACVRRTGTDLVPALLEDARRRPWCHAPEFVVADLESLFEGEPAYDLVTSLGVLQQCGVPPRQALAALLHPLRPGGQLFLTTKNIGWRAFREEGLVPEPGHSWFDPAELTAILEGLGVRILRLAGFLPREGRIVALEDSHSLFLLGCRGP